MIGTERHESRRIDNQLRGRAGRQGDPGLSRFYLSAEDDLIRIFSGDRMYRVLDRFGQGEDIPLEAKILSKTVEGAQKKVEEQNFNIRKRVLEYDDVLNKQREVIYAERRRVLEGEDLSERSRDWLAATLVEVVDRAGGADDEAPADWDHEALFAQLHTIFPVSFGPQDVDWTQISRDELLDRLEDDAVDAYERREEEVGSELMRDVERWALLQTVDTHWREHLLNMDYLREGIHLRGLAQKDPLSEYRVEGHTMFDELMEGVRADFVRFMFHFELTAAPEPEERDLSGVDYSYASDPVQGFTGVEAEPGGVAVLEAEELDEYEFTDEELEAAALGTAAPSEEPSAAAPAVEQRVASEWDKVGRNDACPCGSGKKFKRCHGAAGTDLPAE